MLLLQFSDTHIGKEPDSDYLGVPTRASFVQLLDLARAHDWPPAAVLMTGDLAMDGDVEAYAWLRATLSALGAPVYCLPGNHDHPALMRECLAGPMLSMPAALDLGTWRVRLLNSADPPAHAGRLSQAQLRALSDDLRAHADRPCLVALHHHPVPMQSAWLDRLALEQPAALLAIVDACPNVKAVIWGHVHQAFEAARNGVRLLGSPSTCMQFKPHCETFTLDTQPPGYRWLRLADDGSITSGIRRLERAPTLPSSRMNSVPQ